MQNKGLVRTLAVCLALVCAFYLSFSFITSHYDKKAKEYAAGDSAKEYLYLDSIATQKVWFGYTLKECREREINLGLDLKGGMNVTMEVSVPDILRALSGIQNGDRELEAEYNESWDDWSDEEEEEYEDEEEYTVTGKLMETMNEK